MNVSFLARVQEQWDSVSVAMLHRFLVNTANPVEDRFVCPGSARIGIRRSLRPFRADAEAAAEVRFTPCFELRIELVYVLRVSIGDDSQYIDPARDVPAIVLDDRIDAQRRDDRARCGLPRGRGDPSRIIERRTGISMGALVGQRLLT